MPAPQTVWVTGAGGFLGTAVARRMAGAGCRVVGFARSGLRSDPGLAGCLAALVEGTLSNTALERILDRLGPPEAVFHAAGSGTVGAGYTDPLGDFDRTVGSTAVLVDFLGRRAPGARLVLSSSAAIYGTVPPGPVPESTEPAPASPYGLHKLLSEELCRHAVRLYGMHVAAVRFFSIYGIPQRKLLLWDIGRRLLAGEDPLEIQGTGAEVRDYLHIDDAARFVHLLLTRSWEGWLPINAGSGRAVTVEWVCRRLMAAFGNGGLSFTGRRRPGDPPWYQADTGLAETFSFRPRIALEDGVDAYAAWLKTEPPA